VKVGFFNLWRKIYGQVNPYLRRSAQWEEQFCCCPGQEVALDEEMKKRIEKHKKRRPTSWKTIEERVDISKILAKLGRASIVIIDCLTILISNLLLSGEKEAVTLKKIKEFFRTLKKRNLTTLIVSNEVGMGIVPENRLGRSFRDIAGQTNQIVANLADEVYLLEAGIPIKIKG
jgi:adenosylcobinamide kinase/adenosylcobinamide-phosphate guanylyltransferase